ncbi:unnamed protein product, partial [Strongylus vulgaris]
KRKAREEAEAQREAALNAGLRTPPQKKKHRTKNGLPKLNFGGPSRAPPSTKVYMEERDSRLLARQQGVRHRDLSSSSSFCSSLTNHQAVKKVSVLPLVGLRLIEFYLGYHIPPFSSTTSLATVINHSRFVQALMLVLDIMFVTTDS